MFPHFWKNQQTGPSGTSAPMSGNMNRTINTANTKIVPAARRCSGSNTFLSGPYNKHRAKQTAKRYISIIIVSFTFCSSILLLLQRLIRMPVLFIVSHEICILNDVNRN